MITFIQARVRRTSISKHYQQKAHFATLACVQTSPLPQKLGKEILFSEGRGTSVHRLCDLRLYKRTLYESFKQGGGRGGRCLQGNLWYSPPASMTSRLASVTFKMASKVFIKEKDKNFDFITEILF